LEILASRLRGGAVGRSAERQRRGAVLSTRKIRFGSELGTSRLRRHSRRLYSGAFGPNPVGGRTVVCVLIGGAQRRAAEHCTQGGPPGFTAVIEVVPVSAIWLRAGRGPRKNHDGRRPVLNGDSGATDLRNTPLRPPPTKPRTPSFFKCSTTVRTSSHSHPTAPNYTVKREKHHSGVLFIAVGAGGGSLAS